jgi:fatty-acyl-CoA synthase
VAVVVSRSPGDPPSLDELRTFGAQQLAAYKLPQALRLVAELPLTTMQKVDRRKLADLERTA